MIIIMTECKHNTMHFEEQWLKYIVCNVCGMKWERFVNYTQNTRYTFFRRVKNEREKMP